MRGDDPTSSPKLAESLLFGHEKGAFTGATERRKGALAEASGGTLFLDELGELPIELQPKLLRALSERQVKRVGAHTYEPVDVRVIAATRRDLGQAMNTGRFRSDLFFRIAQVRKRLMNRADSHVPILMQSRRIKLLYQRYELLYCPIVIAKIVFDQPLAEVDGFANRCVHFQSIFAHRFDVVSDQGR